jgi:hypothetical protein
MMGLSLFAASHAALAKETVRLEGMEYLAARKVILGYGWAPAPGKCGGGGTDGHTCSAYPEIRNCSGTGVGLCDMSFVKRDRCLTVVTIGGPPRADGGGEPAVRDVQFRRGPCSQD